MQDMTMAAPTHPYLPTSFPFAKGKEEYGGDEMVPPRTGEPTEGAAHRNDRCLLPPANGVDLSTSARITTGAR
jgi:hypothetical protein